MNQPTAMKHRSAWLATVLRVALGGLFVFAAMMKLAELQQFAFAVKAFAILPDHLSHLAAFVVPWIELIAGIGLLLGLWTRPAALVIGAMLAAFIAGIVSVIVRDLDVTCSCFGKFEVPCTGPVGLCHVIRNLVLLALSLGVMWYGPGRMAVDGCCGSVGGLGVDTAPTGP